MINIIRKIKKVKTHYKVMLFIFLFTSMMNIISICSVKFSTWYRKTIFPIITYIPTRLSALIEISVGEIMIYIGILLVVLFLISICLMKNKNHKIILFRKLICNVFFWCVLFVYVTETFHCFILYHTETIEVQMKRKQNVDYEIGEKSDKEKLMKLYEDTVKELNRLSLTFERTKTGELSINYSDKLMYELCIDALKNISGEYPLLKGYYPIPKKILSSNLMTQQYLAGIYFPFSMEANYNTKMYISNNPATICHELTHLKGYIREDEANFLAYEACIHSDDDFLKYSGYLSIYYYVKNDLYLLLSDDEKNNLEKINDFVKTDCIFISDEEMKKIEKKSFVSTDFMTKTTDTFLNTNLTLNGVNSGIESYCEVVKLILYSKYTK